MKRIFSIITAVLLMGLFVVFSGACSNDSSSESLSPFIGAELLSYPAGSAPPGFNSGAAVSIKEGSGVNITDAAVIMNGISLPYSVPDQQYVGDVVVSSGETVTFSAIVGGGTYTIAGNQFTAYPAISSPTSGSVWSMSGPIQVSWSGGTPTLSAISYGIGVLNADDPNGSLVWPENGHLDLVSKTIFSDEIPAGGLAAGSYLVLSCIVGNKALIPNTIINSALRFIGCSYVPITVQ